MADSNKKVIAFDLYGTLLSTDSIADELAKTLGDDPARELATLCRRYQLEYTWRANSMGTYAPFNTLTRASLQHAAASLSLPLSASDTDRAMRAYDALHVYPEVPAALQAIASHNNHPTNKNQSSPAAGRGAEAKVEAYIFSNGTRTMITSSLHNSPDLKPHEGLFAGVITVDDDDQEVRVYKPHRKTYEHLLRRVGKEGRAGDVWLVSGNPFDVVGAVAVGMKAAWVDREGKGWVDRLGDALGPGLGLGEGLRPTVVVGGVDEAVGDVIKGARSGE